MQHDPAEFILSVWAIRLFRPPSNLVSYLLHQISALTSAKFFIKKWIRIKKLINSLVSTVYKCDDHREMRIREENIRRVSVPL